MMMMMMMMMEVSLGLLLFGLGLTSAAAGPGSCVGRCGEAFTRGQRCKCDFSCLQHNECCQDFEATCTSVQSCQGRCGETFRRGQRCECDPLCLRYNTCCQDYQLRCDGRVTVSQHGGLQYLRASASGKRGKTRSNSESEEWSTRRGRGRCSQYPGAQCYGASGLRNPQTASSSGPARPAAPVSQPSTSQLLPGGNNIPVGLLPMSVPSSPGGALYSLPSHSAPSLGGGGAPMSPSSVNVQLVLSPGGVAPSGPSPGVSGPAGSRPRPRPSTLEDVMQALGLSVLEGGSQGPGSGLSADADLCSDPPISGLTALSNGTVLIFKGQFFWSVDPVSRSVGRPQSITDTLGVSSPIDTVFTRLNCRGSTYIIKGDQCWRLDGNMAMEPGYPKPLASEFPGLTGGIRAALAVPATRTRPETVFFFKTGDVLQRFTFPPGSTPSCSQTPRSSARQAEVLLSGEINIKVSLKGFPSPVSSALSMAGPQVDGYQHYVFSGPLFFSVQVPGDLPVLVKPDTAAGLAPILGPAAVATDTAILAAQNTNPPHPPNSIRVWLRCP